MRWCGCWLSQHGLPSHGVAGAHHVAGLGLHNAVSPLLPQPASSVVTGPKTMAPSLKDLAERMLTHECWEVRTTLS